MLWPPLWAHLFRMREGIRDWRLKRQCNGLPYHSLQSIDTRLHSPVCNIPMRSHSFKSELPPCRGSQIRHDTVCTSCSVFIASSMSGWSGCFSNIKCLADRCLLLYSGLTQGQGHTVRQMWSRKIKRSGYRIVWKCSQCVIPDIFCNVVSISNNYHDTFRFLSSWKLFSQTFCIH